MHNATQQDQARNYPLPLKSKYKTKNFENGDGIQSKLHLKNFNSTKEAKSKFQVNLKQNKKLSQV